MSYEKKEPPEAKVSLKYISWHVKEISENFKILVDEVRKMNGNQDPRGNNYEVGQGSKGSEEPDDIPF